MPISMIDRELLGQHWTFDWNVMDVMIGGASSLDLPRLNIATYEAAEQFAKNYGFDPKREEDLRRLHAMYIEALSFIEKMLMPSEWARGLKPPKEFFTSPDPISLLVLASQRGDDRDLSSRWACAILRVMHTIAHIEGFWRIVGLEEARLEMRSRFTKYIHTRSDGTLVFGTKNSQVELDHLEWKNLKSRSSILLKLLHKRGNVAENVYDLLGVRIVTKRLCDVVLVIRLLEELNIVTFPNCNPARARNTLIDTKYFREVSGVLVDMVNTGKLSRMEFDHLLDRAAIPVMADRSDLLVNPHSGQNYRSVQLTSRLLVNIPNPNLAWLRKVSELLLPQSNVSKNSQGRDANSLPMNATYLEAIRDLTQWVPDWNHVIGDDSVAAFVPFEVQVLDILAFQENKSGDAAHDRYKASQIRTARRRVLSGIL